MFFLGFFFGDFVNNDFIHVKMWWIPHADYGWLNCINNVCMKKKE